MSCQAFNYVQHCSEANGQPFVLPCNSVIQGASGILLSIHWPADPWLMHPAPTVSIWFYMYVLYVHIYIYVCVCVNVHNSICLVYAKFNGLSCMVPGYRFWGGLSLYSVLCTSLTKTPAILKWSSTILTVTHIYLCVCACLFSYLTVYLLKLYIYIYIHIYHY